MVKVLTVALWALVVLGSNAHAGPMVRLSLEAAVDAVIIECGDAKGCLARFPKNVPIGHQVVNEERFTASDQVQRIAEFSVLADIPEYGGIGVRLTRNGQSRISIFLGELVRNAHAGLLVLVHPIYGQCSQNVRHICGREAGVGDFNLTGRVVSIASELGRLGGQIPARLSLANVSRYFNGLPGRQVGLSRQIQGVNQNYGANGHQDGLPESEISHSSRGFVHTLLRGDVPYLPIFSLFLMGASGLCLAIFHDNLDTKRVRKPVYFWLFWLFGISGMFINIIGWHLLGHRVLF